MSSILGMKKKLDLILVNLMLVIIVPCITDSKTTTTPRLFFDSENSTYQPRSTTIVPRDSQNTIKMMTNQAPTNSRITTDPALLKTTLSESKLPTTVSTQKKTNIPRTAALASKPKNTIPKMAV